MSNATPLSPDHQTALPLTGKDILTIARLTDEAFGKVLMLQTWCSGACDGLSPAERQAAEDVFMQTWLALDQIRDILKLHKGGRP